MLRRCCLLFFCLLLSLPVRAEESVALPLTAELRTWLAEHRELRVGVVTEAPYASTTAACNSIPGPTWS